MVGERLDIYHILNFVTLSSARVWTWMTVGRVTFVEQQPLMAWKWRAQFFISLPLSVIFDIMMFVHAANTMHSTARPSTPMFAFEFADLVLLSSSTTIRYLLCISNLGRLSYKSAAEVLALPPPDGAKETLAFESEGSSGNGSWLFYAELWTGKDKLLRYRPEPFLGAQTQFGCCFVIPNFDHSILEIQLTPNTDVSRCVLSLHYILTWSISYVSCAHVIRDAAITVHKFTKGIDGHLRRRRVSRLIDLTFRNAIEDQLCVAGMCAICRIGFIRRAQSSQGDTNNPKVLSCGHVFHRECLLLWFQSQTTCPLCRAEAGVPKAKGLIADWRVLL